MSKIVPNSHNKNWTIVNTLPKLVHYSHDLKFICSVAILLNVMKARYHAMTGAVAASALIPVLGVNSAVFWVASILIDGDHYIDYVYRCRFRDFSIKRMFRFHELLFKEVKARHFLSLNLLHTVEVLIFLYIAGEITSWLWLQAIFWGMLFHVATDLVYMYVKGSLFRRALSIVEYAVRWDNIKRHGCRPEEIYSSVLAQLAVTVKPSQKKAGMLTKNDSNENLQ